VVNVPFVCNREGKWKFLLVGPSAQQRLFFVGDFFCGDMVNMRVVFGAGIFVEFLCMKITNLKVMFFVLCCCYNFLFFFILFYLFYFNLF